MQIRIAMCAVIVGMGVLSRLAPISAHAEEYPACRPAVEEGFSNLQIETADIALHERLFEQVLHANSLQRLDHPQTDVIRIYCFRDVVVTIRQDLRNPRQTGWVQINYWVKDAAAIQETLQAAVRESSLGQLTEADRDKIVRFRMKPGVMRGDRKVDRLEVYGPEGFLIGFDQPKP